MSGFAFFLLGSAAFVAAVVVLETVRSMFRDVRVDRDRVWWDGYQTRMAEEAELDAGQS